ncbi:MAG: hypothetical protein K9W46_00160 [Candidatus Heimdallarchaeum endolithica]|uniref:Uncharacterized protein n=1 Tax=Candidatus Heimdallarchaeum endolithica TaxID=2876572 RepID=A0A9Y1BRR3_9ARCH|nr:MAG: hypothetical protein K9W46_00160 [Candidatus Heimdallarchaeum endolithica]
MKRKKSERFFARTTVEFKTEIDNFLAQNPEHRTYSSLIEEALKRYISNPEDVSTSLSIGLSNQDKQDIIQAINESEVKILEAIDSLVYKLQHKVRQQQSDNVVEEILNYLDFKEAVHCQTDHELASLFTTDYHREFVYDVIAYLRDAGYLRYVRDRIIWNKKKVLNDE